MLIKYKLKKVSVSYKFLFGYLTRTAITHTPITLQYIVLFDILGVREKRQIEMFCSFY